MICLNAMTMKKSNGVYRRILQQLIDVNQFDGSLMKKEDWSEGNCIKVLEAYFCDDKGPMWYILLLLSLDNQKVVK